MKKEILECCAECGISANVLTCLKKYKAPPLKLCFSLSTFHTGICPVCNQKKELTEARDFFYPDFELLLKVME